MKTKYHCCNPNTYLSHIKHFNPERNTDVTCKQLGRWREEEFEDTKGAIEIRKSKDRQCNG